MTTPSGTLTAAAAAAGTLTAAASAGGFTEMQDQAGFVISDQAGGSLG